MVVTPTIDSLTIEGAKRSRPMPAGSVVMALAELLDCQRYLQSTRAYTTDLSDSGVLIGG